MAGEFEWKSLAVDRWWKLLCAAGVAISVAAIAAKFAPALFLGLGLLLIGAGEWAMHPEVTLPAGSYGMPFGTVTTRERRNHLTGWTMNIAGGGLFLIGVIKLALA